MDPILHLQLLATGETKGGDHVTVGSQWSVSIGCR